MDTLSASPVSIADAKKAIEKAKVYLKELFPEISSFRFEEIRQSALPSARWSVTFSYADPDPRFTLPEYKVIEVDAETLDFIQASNR